ncbi:AGE family epimerase/isomerase [Brevundimonas naejangsanensis]
MSIYPVIMCGGAGTRLWPASRPSRPKQFLPLTGSRSLFQDTAQRVAGLAINGGQVVVIAGVTHGQIIEKQLDEIGVEAQILLEPEARDSAAAMAAAAVWVEKQNSDATIVFVASDHFIPDDAAFRRAVEKAAVGAEAGQIVTLGIKPNHPSSAYGYIRATGPGLSPVLNFHEKPDAVVATQLVRDGFLWNSGNFIVSAQTLIFELAKYAPAVLAAARKSLPDTKTDLSIIALSDGFRESPKISIDYAVMEKTNVASVLEANFEWSDLGSWDAIAASGEGSKGVHVLEDSERILTRAPDGVLIATLGVKDLAIIVEPDAVLVCDISKSQEVKKLVARIGAITPSHLDFYAPSTETFESKTQRFAKWLKLRALPLWASLGLGADGGFAESLTSAGRATPQARRARVQCRQIYVYAAAGRLGWSGPWVNILIAAKQRLLKSYVKRDGFINALLADNFTVLDESSVLYDQAFLLFAFAALKSADMNSHDVEMLAIRLRTELVHGAMSNGAFKEHGERPFQSNPHMHLLEAAMAWEELGGDQGWADLADRIVGIATSKFIDGSGGFIREFFDENWDPAGGDDGRLVEPGHQFEWAWLLARYSVLRNDESILTIARRLYDNGRRGMGQAPSVALDAMNDDMTVRSNRARLWPQTERLKAALILAENSVEADRIDFLDDASDALTSLELFFTPDGLWHDKRLADGTFIDEPSPASSLYHIVTAFEQLRTTCLALSVGAEPPELS